VARGASVAAATPRNRFRRFIFIMEHVLKESGD
jgi:hypothetical protein